MKSNTLPEDFTVAYLIALFLVVLFVIFIIVFVVFYNRKQVNFLNEKKLAEAEYENQILQKELETQRSIEKERERISHDMHDDLGAGISALKLQAEFLKKKIEDITLLEDIDDMMKTSEEMNISMREMLWSLNSGNDTLFNFVTYTINFAENFLKKTDIRLTTKKELMEDESVRTETRRNLFLGVKEALNNIYKHSKANYVELKFQQEENQFSVIISDNGIGLQDKNSSGNGLLNMEKRMQNIGGSFQLLEDKNGTSMKFSIPL